MGRGDGEWEGRILRSREIQGDPGRSRAEVLAALAVMRHLPA